MKEVAVELESIRSRRSSHPSDVQEIEERCGNFEIDGIEARDVTFRSTGFEVGNVMNSTREAYSLLSNHTWRSKHLM